MNLGMGWKLEINCRGSHDPSHSQTLAISFGSVRGGFVDVGLGCAEVSVVSPRWKGTKITNGQLLQVRIEAST